MGCPAAVGLGWVVPEYTVPAMAVPALAVPALAVPELVVPELVVLEWAVPAATQQAPRTRRHPSSGAGYVKKAWARTPGSEVSSDSVRVTWVHP